MVAGLGGIVSFDLGDSVYSADESTVEKDAVRSRHRGDPGPRRNVARALRAGGSVALAGCDSVWPNAISDLARISRPVPDLRSAGLESRRASGDLGRTVWRRRGMISRNSYCNISLGGFAMLQALAIVGCSDKNRPMTTLTPKSDLAIWIRDLFIQVTLWDALVLIVVVVAFTLAIFVFSSRGGEPAPTTAASSDLVLEIAWTLGPPLIILMITIPTVRTIFRSQPAVAPAAALKIKVVAYQWWWEFDYPDGVKTSNELHIPINWPVRLELQSGDIIHSFCLPQLGGDIDVMTVQINQLTFIANTTGEYLGQCAEFCGLSHANMRFRVFVDSAENFAAWDKAP